MTKIERKRRVHVVPDESQYVYLVLIDEMLMDGCSVAFSTLEDAAAAAEHDAATRWTCKGSPRTLTTHGCVDACPSLCDNSFFVPPLRWYWRKGEQWADAYNDSAVWDDWSGRREVRKVDSYQFRRCRVVAASDELQHEGRM